MIEGDKAISGVINKQMAREWFVRCLSCSEAMFTILNRGRGIELPLLEQAAHPLAGGFLRQGHACGMAWGMGLAAGVRAAQRFSDAEEAVEAALLVMTRAGGEFASLAGSINCREITDCALTTFSGRLRYLLFGKADHCTRLCIKWAPLADELIERELSGFQKSGAADNCAAAALRACAGALEVEADPAAAAAFAGGLGLSGNVCGALAAAVLAQGIWFYQSSGGRRDGLVKAALQEMGLSDALSRGPERLRQEFIARFGSELCAELTGRSFSSPAELSAFIGGGGCAELLSALPELAAETVR